MTERHLLLLKLESCTDVCRFCVNIEIYIFYFLYFYGVTNILYIKTRVTALLTHFSPVLRII